MVMEKILKNKGRGFSPLARAWRMGLTGFTLAELTVIIVILGILATIALPNFNTFVERQKAQEAVTELLALYDAQQASHQETGYYHWGTDNLLNNFVDFPDPIYFDIPSIYCGKGHGAECLELPGGEQTANSCMGLGTIGMLAEMRRLNSPYKYKLMVFEDGRVVCRETSAPFSCQGLCASLGFPNW